MLCNFFEKNEVCKLLTGKCSCNWGQGVTQELYNNLHLYLIIAGFNKKEVHLK